MSKKRKTELPPEKKADYVMPRPNEDLFDWGGRLADVRIPNTPGVPVLG